MSIRYDSLLRFLRWPSFYLIRALTYAIMYLCEKTGRVAKITGTGEDKDIYLMRYYVIRSRFFNVFIHQFLRPDRDDLHDHPWNFLAYLVDGSYDEYKWNDETKQVDKTVRHNNIHCRNWGDATLSRLKQNSLIFRRATDQHKVVVANTYKEAQKNYAPLTICVTGRTKREWGFWRETPMTAAEQIATRIEADMFGYRGNLPKTRRKWVLWTEYLGLPSDTPGRG